MEKIKDINLIANIAWSFQKTTGLEFDELFGEASLAYCEALNRHDSSKAKLSTWAWIIITNRLSDYVRQERERTRYEGPIEQDAYSFGYNTPAFFELFDEFSSDSKMVVKMVCSAPAEFLYLAPKLARGKIQEMLRGLGWSWSRLWNSYREIKRVLSENH